MRILFVCLALGASAAANATDYVLDPDTLPPGTNVSFRIPGAYLVVESVPAMPFAHSVYEPVFTPLIVRSCGADICPGGASKFGDFFGEGEAAHDCFTGAHALACSYSDTVVLRAVFQRPPTSVSFVTRWWSDDPVLFAYDRFGRVVAECHTHLAGVLLRDDCIRSTSGDLHSGFRTVITLRWPNPEIFSVIVAGSFAPVRIGKIRISIP